MPATYEPIATYTVSGTPSEITFSGISGTYTDLVCVHSLTANATNDVYLRVNGDTANNYSTTILWGSGSAAGSSRQSSSSQIILGWFSGIGTDAVVSVFHVMSYANTNVNKTVLVSSARSSAGVDRAVGLWRSTSAITSLTIRLPSGNFAAGTASLYGIKAA